MFSPEVVALVLLLPYTSRQRIAAGLSCLSLVGSLISQYAVIMLIFVSKRQLLELESILVLLMTILGVAFYALQGDAKGEDAG